MTSYRGMSKRDLAVALTTWQRELEHKARALSAFEAKSAAHREAGKQLPIKVVDAMAETRGAYVFAERQVRLLREAMGL